MSKSKAEEQLALQLRALKVPFVREYVFHPTRKWRMDFAVPSIKFAIEVHGLTKWGKNKNGTMRLGAHQTVVGCERDFEKISEAMLLGWEVYCCSQFMIEDGRAFNMIEKLIELKNGRYSE